MKIILLLIALLFPLDGSNYRVETFNSREVAVICTNGAQPLISQTANLPNEVVVKCVDKF
jgi:hypothetical protein